MIVAGWDVGSLTAKGIIMKDGDIVASEVIRAKPDPLESAEAVAALATAKAGISMGDIEYSVGTGYGRKHIPFVGDVQSDISCHAKGAHWSNPSIRTVIDIGGQDAKAIRVDRDGNVARYVYNDKCASGTGRFLEIIADALGIEIEQMGEESKKSTQTLTLSNQCVVFAETEIITLINDGAEIPDILNALHQAVSNRVASLAMSIGIENEVAMTGGVAKNQGMFQSLQKAIGTQITHLPHPQTNGAIGAALMAQELVKNRG